MTYDNGSSMATMRWATITAVEVVAGIHVALAPDHLREKLYIGVLFVIGSVALTAAALGLAARGGRTVLGEALAWLTAGAVSAGEFGGYLASRTVGLPLGYREEFSTSYENILGYVSLVLEVVAVVCAIAALIRLARTARGDEADFAVDPSPEARRVPQVSGQRSR